MLKFNGKFALLCMYSLKMRANFWQISHQQISAPSRLTVSTPPEKLVSLIVRRRTNRGSMVFGFNIYNFGPILKRFFFSVTVVTWGIIHGGSRSLKAPEKTNEIIFAVFAVFMTLFYVKSNFKTKIVCNVFWFEASIINFWPLLWSKNWPNNNAEISAKGFLWLWLIIDSNFKQIRWKKTRNSQKTTHNFQKKI